MILANHGIISSSGGLPPSTLLNNLYAAYKAESNANDSLGVYNGTAQGGLTYSAGKSGTAFDLNGTNAYIDYGDNFDLGLSSWTYSFWSTTTTLSGLRAFFSKSIAGPSDGRFYCLQNADLFLVGLQTSTTGGLPDIIEIRANSNLITTSSTMITVVFDRTDKIKCYFNSTQITMTDITGVNNLVPYSSVNYNNSTPFKIGAYTAFDGVTPILFRQGKTDEFYIWNRVLTQSEITDLYNSGTGKFYPTF